MFNGRLESDLICVVQNMAKIYYGILEINIPCSDVHWIRVVPLHLDDYVNGRQYIFFLAQRHIVLYIPAVEFHNEIQLYVFFVLCAVISAWRWIGAVDLYSIYHPHLYDQ